MAAKRSSAPVEHLWVVWDGRLTQTRTIVPADIPSVRESEAAGQLICPVCRERVSIVIGAAGPYAEHGEGSLFGGHEPEDQDLRRCKRLVSQHLGRLFGAATVALDGQIDEIGHVADVVMVTPSGGRLAVEVQAAELKPDGVRELAEAYTREGITGLWLLDGRRLAMAKPKRGQHREIRRVTLAGLETGLLAQGMALLYLDAVKGEVVRVMAPKAAVELAALGDAKLGRVDCLVRRYPLTQLRIVDGRFAFDAPIDLPPAVKAPALPANLQKRLAKRREQASQQQQQLGSG